MENQLLFLARLIHSLESGIIVKDSGLKGSFLSTEFKRIKQASDKYASKLPQDVLEYCEFHLNEACVLADVVIRLKVSLKMRKDLTDDEFYRFMKCEMLVKEFKKLIDHYNKEILRQQQLL